MRLRYPPALPASTPFAACPALVEEEVRVGEDRRGVLPQLVGEGEESAWPSGELLRARKEAEGCEGCRLCLQPSCPPRLAHPRQRRPTLLLRPSPSCLFELLCRAHLHLEGHGD